MIYVLTMRCTKCGLKWKQRSKTQHPKRSRCPNAECGKINREIGFDPTGTAPAIGGSIMTRAIDKTAQIVMEDHKLSDLRDNVREGDIMAPKLPAAQQQMADSLFNPAANPRLSGLRKRQLDHHGRRALAGAFRDIALDVKGVLPDNRVGLRVARTEKLKQGQ